MKRFFQGVRRRIRQKLLTKEHRQHVLNLIENGSICAEIGVWRGDFARKMLQRKPAKLHLIDPWLYLPQYSDRIYGDADRMDQKQMDQMYEDIRRKYDSDPRVEVHRTTSEQAAVLFTDEYLDLIYIDGNHSYEFVKNDIESYLPKMKQAGFITGDDYLFDRCPHGGPKRAVDEVVQTGRVKLISIIDNQFILQKV